MQRRDLALLVGVLGLVCTGYYCFRSAPPGWQTVQRAPSAPAPGAQAANIVLTLGADGAIVIAGSVSDAAGKVNLVDAVREAFKPKRLTDSLSIDPRVSGVGRLTLMGRLADEAAKTRAAQSAQKMLAGVPVDNRIAVGAALNAAATQQRKLREALAESSVEFESASARLTGRGKALLDELAVIIQEDRDTHIEVQGHTDGRGAAERNLRLSEARAAATVEYLVEKGIAAKRLSARGYGQNRPIADNDSEQGRRQNRRIEFLVEEGN